jgi:hypothetical protein
MIIFGWGRTTVKKYGPGRGMTCPNCRNSVRANLALKRVWFTLFFIPVIPYEVRRIEHCPLCNVGRDVEKAEFASLLADINDSNSYITGSTRPSFRPPSESAPEALTPPVTEVV